MRNILDCYEEEDSSYVRQIFVKISKVKQNYSIHFKQFGKLLSFVWFFFARFLFCILCRCFLDSYYTNEQNGIERFSKHRPCRQTKTSSSHHHHQRRYET